ncbi:MAG: hypothetical protein Q9227_000501 [Pyrenula ochraceoflavens]
MAKAKGTNCFKLPDRVRRALNLPATHVITSKPRFIWSHHGILQLLMHSQRVNSSAVCVAFRDRDGMHNKDVSFDFGQQKVRGVNIGGWLVLEPWITTSIFQQQDQSLGIVDEYTLCQKNPDHAEGILQDHWNNWLQEGDLQRIHDSGFNMIRIPVGYWAFKKYPGDPYVMGAQDQLDKAIGWANSTGLKVMIDLHGVPLSQNGYDNSGQRSLNLQTTDTSPQWGSQDSVSFTLDVLGMVADKYTQPEYSNVVSAIELVNEPLMSKLPGGKDTVTNYYRQGYNRVRQDSDVNVIIHDGFVAASEWNGFLVPSDNNAQRVILDTHVYQVFSNDQVKMQPQQHREAVCGGASSYAQNRDKWLIVGEWTAAMTDCAPALNGYGVGARYDGTYPGSSYVASCDGKNFIDTWDAQFKSDMTGYIEAQLEVYECETNGWIFWNFKTEAAAEWDLFRLQDAGVFPSITENRQCSSICSG